MSLLVGKMNQEVKIIKKTINNNFSKYFQIPKPLNLKVEIYRERSVVRHYYAKRTYHIIVKGKDQIGKLFEKHIFAKKLDPK